MEKSKRIWNMVFAPVCFFMGALLMWTNQPITGCLFVVIAANHAINQK